MPTRSKNSDPFVPMPVPRRPLPRCLVLTLCACTLACWTGPVRADRAGRISRTSFAHLVPETVGLFAELRLSKDTHQQLRRADFWTLIESLPGARPDRPGESFDWPGLLRRNLGMPPEAALAELFGRRVAVAAPSWERLGEAVILIRMKSPSSLDPVIAAKRIVHTAPHGRLHIYRTITGLWIAADGRIAAFSQDGSDGSLFRKVVDLLTGAKTPTLSKHRRFAEQAGRLPRGYMAYLYFAEREGASGALGRMLPKLRYGVVGMYARSNRVEFELRAMLDQPRVGPGRPVIDLGRVRRLPDSTLFAWAGTLDLAGAYRRLLDGQVSSESERYLDLFRSMFDLEAIEEQIVEKLGQRVIVVWDRARRGGGLPQVSLLLESSDADGVVRALAYGLALLPEAPADGHGKDREMGRVQRLEHLDAEILVVSLGDLSAGRKPVTLASLLLSTMQPSFAVLDGWVVAATSPTAVRQLIDADRGLTPQLSKIRALALGMERRSENRVALALAQPALASAVVAAWQDPSDPSSPWRLDRVVGSLQPSVASVYRPWLGIGIKEGRRSGSVLVVRVDDEKPARGKLTVDDEIIGVDGKLLDLDDPVADLRRRVAHSRDSTVLSLRVRRGNELLDVTVELPRANPQSAPAPPPADPLKALKQLQSIGRLLSYSTYTVYRSPPDRFHARLALQLVSKPPPAAPNQRSHRDGQSRP